MGHPTTVKQAVKSQPEQVTPAKPDMLTEADISLVQRYIERCKTRPRPPKVEVASKKPGHVTITPDHPNPVVWSVLLADTFGTVEPDLADQLLNQIINATNPNRDGTVDQSTVNAALAAVHGIAPRDEIEGILAVQMVSTHAGAMKMLQRAMLDQPSLEVYDILVNRATKLLRVYAAQVEALTRYRGKGQQTVRVEHVHVHPGGQAIVGAVAGGAGGSSKQGNRAHAALPFEPSPPLRGPDPARDAVPVTGGQQ